MWTKVGLIGMALAATAALGETIFDDVTGRGSQTLAIVASGFVLLCWFVWLVAGGADEPPHAPAPRRGGRAAAVAYVLLAVSGCILLARGPAASERAGLVVWVVTGVAGAVAQWRRARSWRRRHRP